MIARLFGKKDHQASKPHQKTPSPSGPQSSTDLDKASDESDQGKEENAEPSEVESSQNRNSKFRAPSQSSCSEGSGSHRSFRHSSSSQVTSSEEVEGKPRALRGYAKQRVLLQTLKSHAKEIREHDSLALMEIVLAYGDNEQQLLKSFLALTEANMKRLVTFERRQTFHNYFPKTHFIHSEIG